MNYEKNVKKCKHRGGGASQLDGIQEFKKSRFQAVFFNVISHLLPNLKLVKERSRNRCAMTEQFSVILNLFQDLITQKLEGRQLKPINVKKSGRQANSDGKKIGRYASRLLSVNSLSSNPPTLLSSNNHSVGNASLIPTYELKKRAAFTLAEVLITLGIIGVVAALTLPSLMHSYRKSVVEKKIYTSYNILQNMIRLSVVDNGDPLYWEFGNWDADIFEKYFAPYLKIVKKCKFDEDNPVCDTSFTSIDGTYTKFYSYKYILSNGVGILFQPGATLEESRRKGMFMVDILYGPKERIIGRNVFNFNFIVDSDRYYITATQDYNTKFNFCSDIKNNRTKAINDCKTGATTAGFGSGIFCTALIECNDWKIPDDYPVHF